MKMHGCHFFLLTVFLFCLTYMYADQGEEYVYLSPQPGTNYVSKYAAIIVRFKTFDPGRLANLSECIRVSGDENENYSGTITLVRDRKTVIFKPLAPFVPGETITARICPEFKHFGNRSVEAIRYQFKVAESEGSPDEQKIEPCIPVKPLFEDDSKCTSVIRKAKIERNGVSIPSDFPRIAVTINNNPDSGYVFLNNWGGQPYNMILDNTGYPVWYWRTWDRRRDFKVQKNRILTMLVRGGYGKPSSDRVENWGFIGLDQHYTVIDTFRAVDGYSTDEHELQVFSDSSYMLIGRRNLHMDLTAYGGRSNAYVRENAIQAFSPEGMKVWEWPALTYFNIGDIDMPGEITGSEVRFPHMNAIDIDDDGHILLSSRHISEITKINRQTGEIIWRLGGAHNEFTFINDPLNGFSSQHDIRILGDGHYTIFDNGNLHEPPVSRAVEYKIDTTSMTATLVWQHLNELNDYYSYYMGNAQRLSNGNTFINWAISELPKATEVTQNGETVFEMWSNEGFHCYRAFRFPWQGMALVPYLVVESHSDGIALIFNKFGDPDVDYYRIYCDTIPNPVTMIDTSNTTLKVLNTLVNEKEYFFRVTSVNTSGQESDFSNEESVFTSFNEPGQNMVLNGNFSRNQSNWYFEVSGSASASMTVENDIAHFQINSGGDNPQMILLAQIGMELIRGENYILEFDAMADAPRTIDPQIVLGREPYTDYSRTGLTYLTNQLQHFSYSFTMREATDFNAFLVFFLGNYNEDVYLDNITLKRQQIVNHEEDIIQKPLQYELKGNYPNPFNSGTHILFSVAEKSIVTIQLYDIAGRFIQKIVCKAYDKGNYKVNFNGSNIASGLYFCRMNAQTVNKRYTFSDTHKILLIK